MSNDLSGLLQLLSHGFCADDPDRHLQQRFILQSGEEHPYLLPSLIQAAIQAITAHPSWRTSAELQHLCRGPDDAQLSEVSLEHIQRPFHSQEAMRSYQYLTLLINGLVRPPEHHAQHQEQQRQEHHPHAAPEKTASELGSEIFHLQQLNSIQAQQLQQRQNQFDAQLAASAAASSSSHTYSFEPSIFVTTPTLLNRPFLSSIPSSPIFSPQLMPTSEMPQPSPAPLDNHHHHQLFDSHPAQASVAEPSVHLEEMHHHDAVTDVQMTHIQLPPSSASVSAAPPTLTTAQKISHLHISEPQLIWRLEPDEPTAADAAVERSMQAEEREGAAASEEAMEDTTEETSPPPLEDGGSTRVLCEQCNSHFTRADFNDHVSQSQLPHHIDYKCQFPRCGMWFGRRLAAADHAKTCSFGAPTRKRRSSATASTPRMVSPKLGLGATASSSAAAASAAAAAASEKTPAGKPREKVRRTPAGSVPRVGPVNQAISQQGNNQPAAAAGAMTLSPNAPLSRVMTPRLIPSITSPFTTVPPTPMLPTPIDLSQHLYSSANAQLLALIQKLQRENQAMRTMHDPQEWLSLPPTTMNEIELHTLGHFQQIRRMNLMREGCLGEACRQRGMLHPGSQPNIRAATSIPCRHLNLCMECIQVTSHCPECGVQIEQFLERNFTPMSPHLMAAAQLDRSPLSFLSTTAPSLPSNLLQVPSPHRPPFHPRSPPAPAARPVMNAAAGRNQRVLPAAPTFRETIEVLSENDDDAPAHQVAHAPLPQRSRASAASPQRQAAGKPASKGAQQTPQKSRTAAGTYPASSRPAPFMSKVASAQSRASRSEQRAAAKANPTTTTVVTAKPPSPAATTAPIPWPVSVTAEKTAPATQPPVVSAAVVPVDDPAPIIASSNPLPAEATPAPAASSVAPPTNLILPVTIATDG